MNSGSSRLVVMHSDEMSSSLQLIGLDGSVAHHDSDVADAADSLTSLPVNPHYSAGVARTRQALIQQVSAPGSSILIGLF